MFEFNRAQRKQLEELVLDMIWLKEQHKKMFARQAAFDRRLAQIVIENAELEEDTEDVEDDQTIDSARGQHGY